MTQPPTIEKDHDLIEQIHNLINFSGGEPNTLEGEIITQLIRTSIKLLHEGHDMGQLKLINKSMKEMRYAYRIFNQYRDKQFISIFGSARTPESHPDYLAAREFSKLMTDLDWMVITGGAEGIMRAGLEGGSEESRFGLSINLPQEPTANTLIEGDNKHIRFKYYFTRKLMFVSHSQAVAAFPGGFGTNDELFEVLTLMQTGKASIIPVVLIEGDKEHFWKEWNAFIEKVVLAKGWISKADQSFYHIASNAVDAKNHILNFYRVFHSYRYVRDTLVIRLKKRLTAKQIDDLNRDFSVLVKTGKIADVEPYPEETDFLNLPRIAFEHNRKHFGTLRLLINRLNEC